MERLNSAFDKLIVKGTPQQQNNYVSKLVVKNTPKLVAKDTQKQTPQTDYYTIKRSSRSDKKYMLITPDGKKSHFGASGMDDFTITGNEEQKNRYIKRHQNEEDRWTMTKENLETPAFLSRFVLWNKPTVHASVNYIEQKLGVKIKVDI